MKILTSLILLAQAHVALGQVATQAPAAQPTTARPITPIAVFLGAPGAPGEVRVFDEGTGTLLAAPPELTDLRLLPLDFVGRTELEAFLPDRPRRKADVPSAARLLLPQGYGALYRYTRQAAGVSLFGFLHVTPEGWPRRTFEMRGLGPLAADDPFVARIGVGPAGRTILVATLPEAGGDLLEFDLAAGRLLNRTAALTPIAFSDAGLWLNPTFGFGAAATGVYRFERTATAQAAPIGFDGAVPPTWFSGQAIVSRSREWALTTAGTAPDSQHAYVFGNSGSMRRVSTTPERLSGAGFLPESRAGPFMAVSDDGALAAWRRDGSSREAFLARVQPQPGEDPTQVTSDAFFTDTLDSVGQMSFFAIHRLFLTVGEQPDGQMDGIEKADVFEVRLSRGAGPDFTNITLTSGETAPPFLAIPTIDPQFMHWLPATGRYILFDDEAERVLGVLPDQPGVQVLITDVKSLEFVEPAGDALLVSVRRASDPRPFELHRIEQTVDATSVLLLAGTPDTEFLFPAAREDGWVGVLDRFLGTTDAILRVHVPTGTTQQFPGASTAFVPPLGFAPSGALTFSEGPPAGPSLFRAWQPGGGVATLQAPAVPGHILAGN